MNITIQWSIQLFPQAPAKTETNIGVFSLLMSPAIDTNQRLRRKLPGCLFQCFPDNRFNQAFSVFEMAGRLVEFEFAADHFFDHQKFLVEFYYGGYGGSWSPNHQRILSRSDN